MDGAHLVEACAFCFNGHPPLGVNATGEIIMSAVQALKFQWAPTLGGECYTVRTDTHFGTRRGVFQWAPTLGGECYPSVT